MADWAKIEAEYRESPRSLDSIGAEHGITEGAIRKKAKRLEWVRNHPKVRKQVRKYGTSTNGYELTEAQHAFVAELQVDMNPTKAAERAGYAEPQISAAKSLSNDAVQAAALERIEAVAARCGLTAELVMRSIVRELQFDPANVFHPDGSMKPIHEIDPDTRMALQSVETSQVGGGDEPATVRRVKWASANQAREQAMKHLGLFLLDNMTKNAPVVREIRLVALMPAGETVDVEVIDHE